MNEIDLVKEIKSYYYQSKFNECIELCNNFKKDQSFVNYQTAQLYKSLSYFYIDQYDEVQIHISKLIEISKAQKGDKMEQIDLLIRIFHLQQVFDENFYAAEQLNEKYVNDLEIYKSQYSTNQLSYDGIYLFAQGLNNFIENWRDDTDLKCTHLLQQALKLSEEYKKDIHFMIGWMYAQKDKYSDALVYFIQTEIDNPQYPGILNSLGVTYSRLKNKVMAENYYTKSHNLFPQNTLYMNNLAQFYNQNQDYEKSRYYFEKSLDTNPKKVLTLYFYGYFLCKQKEYDKGFEYLNKGIEINPSNTDILNAFASINKELDKSEEYEKYILQCINLEPLNGQFYEALGMHYIDQSEFQKAAEQLKSALQYKLYVLNYHSTCSNLAFCYYELEMWEQSLLYYLQSLNYPLIFDTSQDVENICQFLDDDSLISFNKKLEILNQYEGPFLMRIELISKSLTNIKIKNILQKKLAQFRQVLMITAYYLQIQPNLTYMNEISHWDLYID